MSFHDEETICESQHGPQQQSSQTELGKTEHYLELTWARKIHDSGTNEKEASAENWISKDRRMALAAYR